MDTGPTTLLEAVNLVLSAFNGGMVESLDAADTNSDADRALMYIRNESRRLQLKGASYNEELEVTIDPGEDGTVSLPANLLQFRQGYTVDTYKKPLVQRGSKLYDRLGHTYNIGKPCKVDLLVMLDWDDLPQHARDLITCNAAVAMIGPKTASTEFGRMAVMAQRDAQAAYESIESTIDQTTMADNPHVTEMRRGRRRRP